MKWQSLAIARGVGLAVVAAAAGSPKKTVKPAESTEGSGAANPPMGTSTGVIEMREKGG